MRLGALEAGGTKMVCAVGDETGRIIDQISIPTETPEITVPKLIAYFKEKAVEALGIGCFGPIDLDKSSETYGYITSTPKIPWKYYNIVGAFRDALNIPIGFDTDVNGSALGEVTWGALKGLASGMYITIGTGVGVGIYSEGRLLHNMLHPEAGHILLAPHPDDTYTGKCPYHGTCLEGLAAGPAIEARYNKPAVSLVDVPQVWEMEAFYIAQAIMGYILTVAPHRIVLGGGVMKQMQLFPLIRKELTKLLGGYLHTKELEDLDTYIVPSPLNGNQGIMGCFQLALQEL